MERDLAVGIRVVVRAVVASAWLAGPAVARAAEAAATPDPAPLRVLIVPDGTRPEFVAPDPAPARPGFEREILEGFARARGRRVEVVGVKSWEELPSALEAGRGDVIAGHFTRTTERERHFLFTSGVLPTRTVVINRKPDPPITEADALKKMKVGAVRGSASYESLVAAGVPRAHIDDSASQEKLVDLLRTKKVDAIVRAAPLAILNQADDPQLQLGTFLGPPSEFAWGVRKTDGALRDDLNRHLDLARRTGAWSRLVVKYFGPSAVDILRQAEGR
jgi:ABC-type amino acid transport substrate-binding protein